MIVRVFSKLDLQFVFPTAGVHDPDILNKGGGFKKGYKKGVPVQFSPD